MGILVAEQAAPATPSTAYSHLYPKSDGLWYFKDDAGVEHPLVSLLIPGLMVDYGGTTAPAGWLGCDGSNVSRTTFAALFTAIGTTFGAGDGSTTFTLPDCRRRASVGSGGTGTGTLGNAVGNTGGGETHTLALTESPAHTHTGTYASNAGGTFGSNGQNVVNAFGAATQAQSGSVISNGGGGAHNNMQPSLVVFKIIRT